ncbi:hypothetical protein Holit_02358 [Hollandina sp. SP2]
MAWDKTPVLAFLALIGLVLEGCPLFGAGGSVDVTVENRSRYTVTELWVPTRSENNYDTELDPGERIDLVSDWPDGGPQHYLDISLAMNGETYSCGGKDKPDPETKYCRRLKPVRDGEHINIRIFEDHWEW